MNRLMQNIFLLEKEREREREREKERERGGDLIVIFIHAYSRFLLIFEFFTKLRTRPRSNG